MLGLGTLAKKVFGTPNDRKVKATRPLIETINALEPEFEALSDEGLVAKTAELRARAISGEELNRLLHILHQLEENPQLQHHPQAVAAREQIYQILMMHLAQQEQELDEKQRMLNQLHDTHGPQHLASVAAPTEPMLPSYN